MESLKDNVIKGIPVYQNKQDFIIGVFSISQIFRFTKYTERLINDFTEDGIPIYNKKIQRSIENNRVERIADFLVNDPDATFPTNIVLHIPQQAILEQENKGDFIYITLLEKIFLDENKINSDVYITIIDGQHRIRGIEIAIERLKKHIHTISITLRNTSHLELENKLKYYIERLNDLKKIQLVVTFFLDKSIEYQAMIFSTINRTQKRVSQSLVYSLFGLDTEDTPQKTALEIVLALNGDVNSPFYKRIKLYGGSFNKDVSPPLSQAAMVKSIVNLISENLRESENDRYVKRKALRKRTAGSNKSLPFRTFYANNEDTKISALLYNYFKAVSKTFLSSQGEKLWTFKENQNKPENIIQTTVGYDALLRILADILEKEDIEIMVDNKNNINHSDLEKRFISLLLNSSRLNISNTSRYSFNNRGKKILYLDLNMSIWPSNDPNDSRKMELDSLLND